MIRVSENMIQEVVRRITRKGKEELQPPLTYDTCFIGITPQQLRESDLPDSKFYSYRFNVTSEGGQNYDIRINKGFTKWGSEINEYPEVSISLNKTEVLFDDFHDFINSCEKVLEVFKNDNDIDWNIQGNMLRIGAKIDLTGEAQKGIFDTKTAVADFIDILEKNGLTYDNVFATYFIDVTEEEITGNNFPEESKKHSPRVKHFPLSSTNSL